MISIIITSFKEPKTIGRAIESIINQSIREDYELIIAAPDNQTLNVAREYKNKNIKLFQDPGRGKTYALNLLLKKVNGDIIILTDGDVYVSKNSINKILEPFRDRKVGCVTGRPVSINPRNTFFGYCSHLLCYAAHRLRNKRNDRRKFLECSGYLWAFRNNGVIKNVPLETAEDTVVPCIFYAKRYKIIYVPRAKVYVKYPNNLKDFVDQKKRTAKAHETLGRYGSIKKIPRMKSLKNEVLESYEVLFFPETLMEVIWTLALFPLRLYIWGLVFFKRYIKKEIKVDGWNATKSTK